MNRESWYLYLLVYLLLLNKHAQTQTDDPHADDHTCLNTGQVYTGQRHYTLSGDSCVNWETVWKSGLTGFPDASVKAAENFCRDPNKRGTPWCYTSANPVAWALCDIPPCNQRDPVYMTQTECALGRPRAGYVNGDIIPIYSSGWDKYTKEIKFPGCKFVFEACKDCKFHLKVDADLPACTSPEIATLCSDSCQTLAIRDGLYNSTIVKLYRGTVSNDNSFDTVSNVLVVEYCQLMNDQSQAPARYSVTAYVTTKHIHQTAKTGFIKSPNFPYGYFSEKETYVYSVDTNQTDTNVTLIFYDWDLNGSAGSTILIHWTERNQTVGQNRTYSSTDVRPALFIPASSFSITFNTGSINVNYLEEELGFLAEFDHVTKQSWPEMPDTQCGRYLPRSESIGGYLTYKRLSSPDINNYTDCIWVIPVPSGYTHMRINVEQFIADTTVYLTIRDGQTSEGPTVPTIKESISTNGFFVHIQGRTQTMNIVVNISYLASAKAYGGECRPSLERQLMFYCNRLDTCIDQELYATHAEPICGITNKPQPLQCVDYMCADGAGCYSVVEKCNMFRDCKDGSDESVETCYKEETKPGVNLAMAISLPIVGVVFVIPIVIIIFCIIRQRRQELADPDLVASRDKLVGIGGGKHDGLDNPGLQLDDASSFADGRRPQRPSRPVSLADIPAAVAAPLIPTQLKPTQMAPPQLKKANPKFDEIRADIHTGKSPYSPRAPGETQSMRVDPGPISMPSSAQRPTRSHRFELPPDIDRIEELHEEPRYPNTRHPARAPRAGPTTLANYKPDTGPVYDRTPEGRSYRDPTTTSYRIPEEMNSIRQPGDGSNRPMSPYKTNLNSDEPYKSQLYTKQPLNTDPYRANPANRDTKNPKYEELPINKPVQGARPKVYEPRYSKNPNSLSQYKPNQALPRRVGNPPESAREPQTTQSYRVEADKYAAPPREARSYRYEPEMQSSGIGSSTNV